MGRAKQLKEQKPPKFRVGDWVSWVAGNSKHLAVVIEVGEVVGLDGQRTYMLREFPLWTPYREYGLSEQFLEPAEPPEKLPEPHDKLSITEASYRRLDI